MITFPQIVKALAWSGLERLGSAALFLVSAFVIATIVGPEAFGVGSLALSVVFAFQLAAERLFHDVIVRKPDLLDAHAESALVAATVLAGLMFGGVWLAAGPLAQVFGRPELASLIILAGAGILAAGPGGVVAAMLHRRLEFDRLAIRTLIGVIAGSVAGVAAALMDQGAAAVVIQAAVQGAATGIAALFSIDRIPRFRMHLARLRELMGFSATALAEILIYTGAFRVFLVIVGLTAGVQVVGYLELASRLSTTLGNLWTAAVAPVMLSTLTAVRKSREALASAYARATELNAVVVLPAFCGLAFVAGDVVTLALGPEWLPVTPALQIFAIECAIRLSRMMTPQVFYAAGRPTFALYGAISGFVAANGLLLILAPTNPTAIAAVWSARIAATTILGGLMLRALTGLTFAAQYKPMLPALLATLGMLAALALLHVTVLAAAPPAARAAVEIVAGAAIYGGLVLMLLPGLCTLGRDTFAALQRKRAGTSNGRSPEDALK